MSPLCPSSLDHSVFRFGRMARELNTENEPTKMLAADRFEGKSGVMDARLKSRV
jgi:hypothetical protein